MKHNLRELLTTKNINYIILILLHYIIAIIRPVLEYASAVWSPWLRKDILALESVQKRCLKLCKESINCDSLESRRKSTDMVETFKYLTGRYKTDPNKLFSAPLRKLRGHSMKLFKHSAKKEVHRNFFTNRVVDHWNSLSETVIGAPSVDAFTRKLRAVPME